MAEMNAFSKLGKHDLESGYGDEGTLYPGLSLEDNELRWGFIRKVYGILSVQFLLTLIVASAVVSYTPFTLFLVKTPGLFIGLAFLPLILLCPLYCYHQKHPVNLVLLGLFTVVLSLTVGISCAFTKGKIVLEALILTAAVVFSLTGYTFWASKKGKDFSFLGPILFASLLIIILFGLIQVDVACSHDFVFAGFASILCSFPLAFVVEAFAFCLYNVSDDDGSGIDVFHLCLHVCACAEVVVRTTTMAMKCRSTILQAFFPLGSLSTAIYGGLAALIFSGYIVYDTDNLIKRYNYDQYIWASVVLYLDILNLFLSLLQLLRGTD